MSLFSSRSAGNTGYLMQAGMSWFVPEWRESEVLTGSQSGLRHMVPGAEGPTAILLYEWGGNRTTTFQAGQSRTGLD